MKRFIPLLLTITLIYASVKIYKTSYNPCDTTITYNIGKIDPKFKLNSSDVLAETNEAVSILNTAYGSSLFKYSKDSGGITVNFVYDERTALEEKINSQRNQIDRQNSTIQQKVNEYEADVKIFETKLSALNATIQKYNSEGGAPPEVYQDLTKQQNELRTEGNALNLRAKQLNLETHNFNTDVNSLNQGVKQFNEAISEKPEEGVYDGNDNTITVFFVNNREELLHTLTHEFGHARGMDHVDDPKAIMYPYSSKSLTFTEKDKDELFKICKTIPVINHWLNILSANINYFITFVKTEYIK